MVGVPVIINHKDLNKDNADDERVGVVNSVWFDEKDGWFWCDGIIWNETAQNLITDKNWSVSCSYDVKTANDEGGSENNIKYDMEFLDGVFTHLALVNNPRYERANIVFNSKTEVINYNPDQKRNERGQWVKDDALIQQKKDKLIPIEINGDEIPQFETKKDLANWVKGIFADLGSVNILDTDTEVILTGSSANRETAKHRSTREENKAVFHKFQEMVEKSIKTDEKPADERHIHDQDLYFNKMQIDGTPYDVELIFDYLQKNNEFRYAGHKIINSIKIAPSHTQALNALQTAGATNSINDLFIDFNPNVKENEDMNVENETLVANGFTFTQLPKLEELQTTIDNSKETDMTLLEKIKDLIRTVENEKGDDMDDKEKIENEKVDKRKLIDEVGGILKGKVDDEIIRTIIGKMEKMSYDESETGKADNEKDEEKEDKKDEKAENCGKKVKNEDEKDKEKVEEVKEELKEDVDNKCKNSKESYFDKMNKIYNSAVKPSESEKEYVLRADRLKAAEDYFKV